MRELLHWGPSSAQGSIRCPLSKGPMRCLLRSCKLWVNLYDYSVFSCLCPLSMSKHWSFPCLWLQPSKISWSFLGEWAYISHTKMFSPSFEHSYDYSWGKTDLSSQIHQIEQHHEAFLWFSALFCLCWISFVYRFGRHTLLKFWYTEILMQAGCN